MRIRELLESSPFLGEGYRKTWARLRHRGIRTSKDRVRRLMRAHDLQAPDEMWGTDATAAVTREEGAAFVFIAVDHCTSECVGIHASRSGSRHEALEPVRQAVRTSFGGYDKGVATGLSIRHDHGSQYMSHDFQDELRFLGVKSTPSFVANLRTVQETVVHYSRWCRETGTKALCALIMARGCVVKADLGTGGDLKSSRLMRSDLGFHDHPHDLR